MKFKFRLDTILRHRKIEQDLAQKEFSIAQQAVRDQLAHIKKLYASIDDSRAQIEAIQAAGGACSSQINSIELFIEGQILIIARERQRARELMQIEEEKHEVLVLKMQDFKVLEKMKEKKKEEFRKIKNKKIQKNIDDMVTMRFKNEVAS
ncbi:MAG: flagellar export protein FliJ [Bdellovibrionales bacterium]|nr:flagellar export protein FliJ [Bdellovibrionales bacterium]